MLEKEVDELIDVLKIKKKQHRGDNENKYWDTTEGKITKRSELRGLIRKTLGIDKQCFQCSNYFFDYELSVVEGTPNLVCQGCAELIIGGKVKLNHGMD